MDVDAKIRIVDSVGTTDNKTSMTFAIQLFLDFELNYIKICIASKLNSYNSDMNV